MVRDVIEFRNISKIYQGKPAVSNLTLDIADGELFVLVGPSGSGKTTSMKMINRLVEPTDGDTYVRGKRAIEYDLVELRRGIGYVLQNSALFPNMTIFQNAGIQLEAAGVTLEQRRQRVYELLNRVGLPAEQYADRMPNELSGGEQQRVGIVRALATKPDIILMDEPFSALDPLSRRSLQDLVLELHADLHTTILFVTHDMSEATRLGNRIGVMYDGVLQQVGTPTEVTTHPANELVEAMFSERPATMIQAILDAGFGEPITELGDEPQLQATDYLAELSKQLVDYPAVVINGTTKLTVQDLLQYLAAF